jgi:ABC-type antimicrobial peptide transport system permease subunit
MSVLMMMFVSAFAAYVPACHASRIDPLIALRHE